jgi:glyceraldehyde 3-phosphate dehydrogenase
VHGRARFAVGAGDDHIVADGKKVACVSVKEPENVPWGAHGADVVLECTGKFTDKAGALRIMQGGAKKVIISAPAKDPDLTVVVGVNDKEYDGSRHHVVSNASCTTNCLAPVAKVLHESFGIEKGLMTTVHSYTNDQNILDRWHKDPRRARAAATNMVPTTTGAAKAVSLVLPALKGKLHGMAVRVPTPNVSLVDLTVTLSRDATADEINAALRESASGSLRGILDFTMEPLVSGDFIGSAFSSVVDGDSTTVIGGNLAKVLSWYDNEWGFSNRMADLARIVAG